MALMDILTVIYIDETILRSSLVSPIPDYEDAVIPALTPEQFLLL